MTIKTITCHVIVCNVCGRQNDDDSAGYTQHFDDPEHAAEDVRDCGWDATENGAQAVCDTDDDAHKAARLALLPPEPITQIPGQVSFDGEVSS